MSSAGSLAKSKSQESLICTASTITYSSIKNQFWENGCLAFVVVMRTSECDLEQIKANLLEDWNISCPPPEEVGEDSTEEKDGTLVFDVDGFMLAVSFVDAPVPDGEAEYFAQANYLWKDAVEVTKTHVAQIILAVFTRSGSPLDSAKLYTKLAASCLKLPNAIGIYTSGTVFQPEIYVEFANLMKSDDDMLPLLNLVHFGLVSTENGISGYTYGLRAFGKDEIEILDSGASPNELRDFLIDVSGYILEQDVTLRDGETIGFSAEQKLKITRSEGVYVNEDSLKIQF